MSDVEAYRQAINDVFHKAGHKQNVLLPASAFQLRYVRTGSRALDRALGGGIAIGRSAEFMGPLSTLKSYFSQKMLANAQQLGMRTALLDTEGSFEPRRAVDLGVDLSCLDLIDTTLRGDEQLDVVEAILLEGNAAVVVDSVAALLPKAEAERRIGEDTVARQAALMSRAMRKLTAANHRDSVLLFINQLRDNVGVMFGPRDYAPGGRALGFYATHRVRFSVIETIKEKQPRYRAGKLEEVDRPVAQLIQARVDKSKVNRPHQEAVFRYDLERGQIDEREELLNLGLELGIIRQDGQFYELQIEKKVRARFRSGAIKALGDHGDAVAQKLDEVIYAS